MDFLAHIKHENELLNLRTLESSNRWKEFWLGLSSYVSVVKIGNRPILSPVMTVERRQEMQVLKKQAIITEFRLKTKSREKQFLNRVERSLEEIQRETSEKEMSLRSRENLSGSANLTDNLQQVNNNSSGTEADNSTTGLDTDSTVPGETIHLRPAGNMKTKLQSPSHSSRVESSSAHTSDSEDLRPPIIFTAPKIHRRRRESGGSTGSETSVSPSEITRHRSQSNSSVSSEPVRLAQKEGYAEHASVRRTESDSCRLRRSGSERSLKRSGSDRALRRTGSGDIPTAIMSESTPRMHRRAGSGDMSFMQPSKQSAMNKLTRSYDMSLRSLMSAEELNVKVQPPVANRDQCNDLLTEPSPSTGHNLLMSPKFNTGKDPAAVKLLSRPTAQSIKKQVSPSKESGPPQPIKAIHKLPASLPASRENTFDSLPQRSPPGSENDNKDDRPTNFFADSLDVSASKTETAGSKATSHRRSPSPHRGLSSPHKREPSPHRGLSSPHKREPSPHRSLSSPHKREPSPHRSLSSPHKREPSPHRSLSSPHKREPSPHRGLSSPQKREPSPHRSVSSPHKHSPLAASDHPNHLEMQSNRVRSTSANSCAAEESSSQHTHRDRLSRSSSLRKKSSASEDGDSSGSPSAVLTTEDPGNKLAPPHTPGQLQDEQHVDETNKLSDAEAIMESRGFEEEGMQTVKPVLWNLSDGATCPESPGFLQMPDKLMSSTEYLTQQWLVEKVSQLHSSGQVNIEDWLQNAPDSVKQKLTQLLPSDQVSKCGGVAVERQSPVDLSIDDTLRNTSPIPDSDQLVLDIDTPSTSPQQPDSNRQESGSHPLFNRSNSYTLERPSVALLLAEKSQASPSSTTATTKFFPSPDKSESLPSTHNRVEAKHGHPNSLLDTLHLTASSDEPAVDVNAAHLTSPAEHLPNSPTAIERNKAISSKSYTVEQPSAALLDSMNESQKLVIETDVSNTFTDEMSMVSESTLKECPAGSKTSSVKSGVQRKLNYFSLSNLAAQAGSSSGSKYHPLKYDSADVPKRAHIQKYLQQLRIADKPVREAWGDSKSSLHLPHESPNSSCSAGSENVSSPSSPELANQSAGGEGDSTSSTSSKNSSKKQPVSKEDMFRVRRELTLLKSKHSKKLSPRSLSSQRPGTAQPSRVGKHQVKERTSRPSTAAARTNRPCSSPHSPLNSSADTNLARLKQRLSAVTNRQAADYPTASMNSSHAVKSFAEKEATPISVGYAPAAVDESISEYSTYGAIHSVTHPRPSTASTPSHSHISQRLPPSTSPTAARLAAVIKGHLCRRLLATYKVQSIVKTIRDCRSLLPQYSMQQDRSTLSLQDLNFQQRLLDQWQAALVDIHEIFFDLAIDKRISLIHQSEAMAAKVKAQQQQKGAAKVVRTASNKEQQPPKRRIAANTVKVAERKKIQKSTKETSATIKPAGTTTLKKAVLAPTFAANSPKKYTPASTANIAKLTSTYTKRSSTRTSKDLTRHTASKV